MKNYILFLVFIGMIGIASCKKDKCYDPSLVECENYDPCFTSKEVKAKFKIYNPPFGGVGEIHPLWETEDISAVGDSIYASSIIFEAEDLGSGTTYTWQLGTETLNGRIISRGSFPIGATTSVTLEVNRDPDLNCYPLDDGQDVTTRYFHTFEYDHLPKYLGEYRGVLHSAPNDSFNIRIEHNNVNRVIIHRAIA